LRCQLAAANRRLAICRSAWRQWPCALAIVKQGRWGSCSATKTLTGLCGLAPGAVYGERDEALRTEEYLGRTGRRGGRTAAAPAGGGECRRLSAEFMCEVSDGYGRRANGRRVCEDAKILVNMFEMKDPYSNGHSEVVSNLAHDLAKTLGLPPSEAETIARAGLLHDIGKIIVPAETLNKPGELTAAEYKAVQTHPAVGADILATLGIFREEAIIVRHHHERFDGGGYPDGLRGGEIPRGARIIAIADAFDAMTSGRSVRGRRTDCRSGVINAEKAVIRSGGGGRIREYGQRGAGRQEIGNALISQGCLRASLTFATSVNGSG
jgi:putative nucleotidyltransferase with HDIG domain